MAALSDRAEINFALIAKVRFNGLVENFNPLKRVLATSPIYFKAMFKAMFNAMSDRTPQN